MMVKGLDSGTSPRMTGKAACHPELDSGSLIKIPQLEMLKQVQHDSIMIVRGKIRSDEL
jgi:hypothetical protein